MMRVATCSYCPKVQKLKKDRVNLATYRLPFNWYFVNDEPVCSFSCAAEAYNNIENKTLYQKLCSIVANTFALAERI